MEKIVDAKHGEEGRYYRSYQDGDVQIVTPKYTSEDGGYFFWAYVCNGNNSDTQYIVNGEKIDIDTGKEVYNYF